MMGMPVVDLLFKNSDGEKIWVNKDNQISNLTPIFVDGIQVSRTWPSTPTWWPKENGVLFLDDFTRSRGLMQCAMEMFQRKVFLGTPFPNGVTVIGSSNPEGFDYEVVTLDAAQATRMLTYDVVFDTDYWLEYAESRYMDSIVSFCRVNPEIWNSTCAREVSKFNDIIKFLDPNDKDYYSLVTLYGRGALANPNNSFANLFVAYLKEQFKNLPSIEEIYAKEGTAAIESKLSALVKDKNNANASMWVVAIRLVKGLIINGITPHSANRFMFLINSNYFTTDKKTLIYNMFMKHDNINTMLNQLTTYEPSYGKWVADTIAKSLTDVN
jgi:hypothetical protein